MPIDRWTGALRERNFRLLFIGQTASQIGTGMAPVAIVFAVLAHGSVEDVGYVLAAQTIPLVVLLLVGGVVGDLTSRRKLMLQSDALRTLAEFALGLWILLGRPSLVGFMILAALMGIGQAFFNPALTAIVPQLLSAQRLQEGNALLGIANSSGTIIGPAIAGIVVAVSSPGWAILMDGATYLVSVVSLSLVQIDWSAAEITESFTELLIQGWREFWSRTWLWVVVIEFSFVNALFASFLVLGPEVAKNSLGGAASWGLIIASEGVGSVLGGVVMLRARPRRPLLVATLSTLAFPLPLFFIAVPSTTIVVASAAFVAGGFVAVFSVLWSTTLQNEIPTQVLSRISAYDWFGSMVLLPIGMAGVAPIAAIIGVRATLFGSGGLMVLLICVALAIPSVRRLRQADSG